MAAAPKRVLVTGASIAGPIAAYWLARANGGKAFKVTILERAPMMRTAGQGIDVRGAGVEVVRRMGLEDEVRAASSHEEGMHCVDESGRIRASFPVGKGELLTSDIEIARGDLAELFVAAAEKQGVEFQFGDYIKEVEETPNNLRVTYANSKKTHDYDILIIGDGLYSRTRDIVFGPDVGATGLRSLGAYVAYFTIPSDKSDNAWGRWLNAPGRRALLLRPDTVEGSTRVVITICTHDQEFEDVIHKGTDVQKQLFSRRFLDAGWQSERIVKGMIDAGDFYMQKLAQVKLEAWTKGRVALIGDAGYCPSPLTGMGTTCAIVGAYVLAGELVRSQGDHIAAFAEYDKLLRPFVAMAQKLAPGVPHIVNPETWWGVEIMRTIIGFVSWAKLYKLFGWLGGSPTAKAIELPDYEM